MDKNTITGIVLIGLLLFGFTFYQNKQYQKQAAYQAQLDSIALVKQIQADSIAAVEAAQRMSSDTASVAQVAAAPVSIYKDSLLEAAHSAEAQIVTLANDKFEVAFTTKGAQPYSVKINEYSSYGGGELFIFKPEMSRYDIQVYAGETINTADFNFVVAEKTDTSLAMRLPFAGGGYIEQRYSIAEGSYSVKNYLSFVGMENVIPKNVFSFDVDYFVTMPRMEKGYKSEVQYSKLDYYFNGEKKPEAIAKGRSAQKRVDARVSWFAFQQQFFSAIMRSPQEFASADFALNYFPEDDESHNLMTGEARLRMDFQPGQHETVVPFEFYFGPNHFKTLKSFDQKYEKIIPLGGWLVGWFTRFVILSLIHI